MKRIFFLLLLALVTHTLIAQQEPSLKTITVSGSAEMEIVPDQIYVMVELKEYKKGGNRIELESIKKDFLNYCKQAGLADSVVSIAAYQGGNLYWWKKKKEDLYSSISYQVKFSDSKNMDALVALLDDNATESFQILRTYHTRMSEFRRQLKIEAIKAAKDKASYMAEAIDEKAGEAISINEVENNSSWYPVANAVSQVSSRYNAGSNDGGVNFKTMKLRYEVTAVFALK